jgi:type IV pilus assembly protein PilM
MSSFAQFARSQFAPPKYLSMPTAGIDLSVSGIKGVLLTERNGGLEVESFINQPIPSGAIVKGEVTDPASVARVLSEASHTHHMHRVNVGLPEMRGYLFEATVESHNPREWRAAVEQHLDEYVPLPPAEVVFDIVPFSSDGSKVQLIGIGYARRVIDQLLVVLDESGIEVSALESEIFALPRAVLPRGTSETALIIDIGKSSTKLTVASHGLPRLATTLDVGGHALTLAVQKYFGVTEEEAKKVKAEKGLVVGKDSDEYVTAMFSTISVIREEVLRRMDYWESRKATTPGFAPVTRAILVGGNANVRGLPEYLESTLKIPVELGNVFANCAPRSAWLPPIDFNESLSYGTAVGLALRHYES